jgi:hypothetical protein
MEPYYVKPMKDLPDSQNDESSNFRIKKFSYLK